MQDSEEPSDEEEENELIKLKREICVDKLKSKQIFDDLDSSDCSLELAEKLCKLIAELAKDETCRNFLVEQNLFKPLNKFLTSSSSTHLVQTQVCRAIGNLCYYNGTKNFYYALYGSEIKLVKNRYLNNSHTVSIHIWNRVIKTLTFNIKYIIYNKIFR